MVTVVEHGLTRPDPWEGLVEVFRAYGAAAAERPGFAELVATLARGGTPDHRYVGLKRELIARCQAAGRLRPDVGFEDVGCLTLALTTVARVTQGQTPGYWERHLALLLDGLQARGPLPLADGDGSLETTPGKRRRARGQRTAPT